MINVSFYLRRLHSLCGLVMLGGVLIEHLLTNASAMGGEAAFNQGLEMMELIPPPIFFAIEICFYAVPLLFHGIYGMYIANQAKNNPTEYGYSRNWKFALQRWTAWYLVVFLIWHVGYLRIYTKGIMGEHISYALVQSTLANPVVFGLYALGMFAAIFHFCNGITTFCMTWGITKGPRSQCVVDKM
ncbi:MAG: succinate dehydrogenase, partial [Anaerovibrio sp.]|nr:succinate dehydrogenase [Anaerovibrio sp.]